MTAPLQAMIRKFAVPPRFLAFLAGLAVSKIGDNLYLFAVPLLALKLGPVIGVLTDRWDRRRTMLAADLHRVDMAPAPQSQIA